MSVQPEDPWSGKRLPTRQVADTTPAAWTNFQGPGLAVADPAKSYPETAGRPQAQAPPPVAPTQVPNETPPSKQTSAQNSSPPGANGSPAESVAKNGQQPPGAPAQQYPVSMTTAGPMLNLSQQMELSLIHI